MKKYFLLKNVMLLIVLSTVLFSCKKDNNDTTENVPTLSTSDIISISGSSAASGGNITDDGGVAITERGVCWNTNSTPTIANNKTSDGAGTGIFTSQITGLTANTKYYVRAFATNSSGTFYGDEKNFTTINSSIGEGVFKGSTSKNQDVYLHINGQSKIDSITVKIKINFVTYYCTYTFYCKTDIQADKTIQFEAKLTNPSIFICSTSDYPVLKGTFDDDNNCSGIIGSFKQCGGLCGSMMTFGSGSTVSELTWSVKREN